MNILFFTGFFEKNPSVTAGIALNIASQINKGNHRAEICGISKMGRETYNLDNVTVRTFEGEGAVYHRQAELERYVVQANTDRSLAVKKFVPRHPVRALAVKFGYSKNYDYSGDTRRAKEYLEKAVNQTDYDRCVALLNPFWGVKRLTEADLGNCKKIVYQLDPYGLHKLTPKGEVRERILQETGAFRKADLIFTTPALLREYEERDEYRPYLKKMFPADFPLFIPAKDEDGNAVIKFDSDYTNILFCGLLEDSYRPIEKLLHCLSILWDRGEKIRLYLVGDIISRQASEFLKKYPKMIFFHDRVSPGQSRTLQTKADFLLNCGNKMENMVPSKIFEYFARGKPVIHIKNTDNCPAVPYMEKYPLSFVLDEDGGEERERLSAFLTESKGKSLAYSEGLKIFKENTPEYLAELFTQKLRGLEGSDE